MQPDTTTASAGATRPAFPDPVRRNQLAAELEEHLLALNNYCDQEPQPPLAYQLNEFITALGQYEEVTEQLLSDYQHALEQAERPLAKPAPTLEQAILAQLSPADLLSHREADPVYRLGYVRGYRKAEQRYERLSSLYAQYAIIVPPASYTPSPLVAQVQRFITARLMTGPRFPLPIRKSLFFSTPNSPTND